MHLNGFYSCDLNFNIIHELLVIVAAKSFENTLLLREIICRFRYWKLNNKLYGFERCGRLKF